MFKNLNDLSFYIKNWLYKIGVFKY
jgi:hypothetical protein